MAATASRTEFTQLLDRWLSPATFKDVGENGLQVEGASTVSKVVCGVTANLALIDHAVAENADAIVVHHGLVWGGGIRKLTGWLGQRVRRLMANDVNLYGYHLPLDAHPELGNNAGLADALGLGPDRRPFGNYKGQAIGIAGALDAPLSLSALTTRIIENVGPPQFVSGDDDKLIRTVGLCTGGAPDLIHEAVDEGLDLYMTGESTEFCDAISAETGVAFVAGGHHQTERFGAQRIARALAAEGFDATFYDVENPA